jgi:uncharacterized membrane protein YphA (DoxX/SURF4 family)
MANLVVAVSVGLAALLVGGPLTAVAAVVLVTPAVVALVAGAKPSSEGPPQPRLDSRAA